MKNLVKNSKLLLCKPEHLEFIITKLGVKLDLSNKKVNFQDNQIFCGQGQNSMRIIILSGEEKLDKYIRDVHLDNLKTRNMCWDMLNNYQLKTNTDFEFSPKFKSGIMEKSPLFSTNLEKKIVKWLNIVGGRPESLKKLPIIKRVTTKF